MLLIYSVRESGGFQGIARLAAGSDPSHPPVHWLLPPGMTAKGNPFRSVFRLHWLNRLVELVACAYLLNWI